MVWLSLSYRGNSSDIVKYLVSAWDIYQIRQFLGERLFEKVFNKVITNGHLLYFSEERD